MVDVIGPIEIAAQRPGNERWEDQKINLIVHKLARYNILVGALQETRWLGNEV